eukprot:scaffold554558_cov48-Prasinocladus_malaysianus.AAC.1
MEEGRTYGSMTNLMNEWFVNASHNWILAGATLSSVRLPVMTALGLAPSQGFRFLIWDDQSSCFQPLSQWEETMEVPGRRSGGELLIALSVSLGLPEAEQWAPLNIIFWRRHKPLPPGGRLAAYANEHLGGGIVCKRYVNMYDGTAICMSVVLLLSMMRAKSICVVYPPGGLQSSICMHGSDETGAFGLGLGSPLHLETQPHGLLRPWHRTPCNILGGTRSGQYRQAVSAKTFHEEYRMFHC